MTKAEATTLCGLIPTGAYTRETGMGRTDNPGYAAALKAAFPEFNWRVILVRTGERSRWALTVDDDDPREHYFLRLGGACIHCGKTARQLAVAEDPHDDGEGFTAAVREKLAAV